MYKLKDCIIYKITKLIYQIFMLGSSNYSQFMFLRTCKALNATFKRIEFFRILLHQKFITNNLFPQIGFFHVN